MSARKPFLLRMDPGIMAALQRWAADDLRSLNGQIEFLLRRALVESGRLKKPRGGEDAAAASPADGEPMDGPQTDRD